MALETTFRSMTPRNAQLRARLTLLASSAVVLCASSARAAEPAAAPAAEPASADVSEVVVTARRREERLQDVPMAVSAATGATLQHLNISRADELTRLAPGMVINTGVYGNGNLNPTVRGQRQALNNATYDQSVGVYFAEVPQARTQGLNSALFDLDSVQVLKGPQGTLFGRNTTGGAVLITPKAPAPVFGGYVQGTYGNYDLKDLEGAINAPFLDGKLQVRLSGKVTRHEGYEKDIPFNTRIGDQNDRSWRLSVRFQPTEQLQNTLVVNGYRELDSGTPFKLIGYAPTVFAANHNWAGQVALLSTQPFHTTTALPLRHGTDIMTFSVSNITTYDLGGVTLKNIFGYRRTDANIHWNINGDIDNAYDLIAIDKGDQFSDEINISGTALNGDLQYFGGLFWFRENNFSSQYSLNGYGLTSAQLAAGAPRSVADTVADPIVNESYSAYAQATYKFPQMPDLSLTAGLRFTYDQREITWKNVWINNTTPNSIYPTTGFACRMLDGASLPLNPCVRSDEKNWSQPTWTLSLDYKVSPDLLVYVAHRHGYRSGGFTFTAYIPREAAPFQPEKVNDVELGAKGNWRLSPDVRLQLNVAAYHQNYSNIQRNVTFTSIPPGGTVPITSTYYVNAASAKINGVEIDGSASIGDVLDLSGSFAYSDAKYDKYVDLVGIDFTNAPFAGAPKYTATWAVRYRLYRQDSIGEFMLSANGLYQSSTVSVDGTPLRPPQFGSLTTTFNGRSVTFLPNEVYPIYVLEARHIVDARLEWNRVMGTRLDLQLFAKNLFDKNYFTYLQDNFTSGGRTVGVGLLAGVPGAPRTFGLQARYEF